MDIKEKILRFMEELKQENEDIKPLHKNNTHLVLIKCSCKRTECRIDLKEMNKHLLNK